MNSIYAPCACLLMRNGPRLRLRFSIRSMVMEPPIKRQKFTQSDISSSDIRARRAGFLASLSRGVSPPPPPDNTITSSAKFSSNPANPQNVEGVIDLTNTKSSTASTRSLNSVTGTPASKALPSPIRLTKICDLPDSENQDTISLHDILGDPLIREAWIFNFCFDVDWLMQHFDPDTQHLVKVKIVHGSWRREDMNKIMIDTACSRMANVDAIQAYLPDAFGTHHSKMFILFRHDDTAQVIIHTANMLAKDWTNMTQAVWTSPMLPKARSAEESGKIGSGSRFKHDLLRYLRSYGTKLKGLINSLDEHSFDEVRAALVASVPSKLKVQDDEAWGHEALRRTVKDIPVAAQHPHFVFQVSSIASLPATWMNDTLYQAMATTASDVSIIFPTVEDVRTSLDGYSSGASVHMKSQKDVHLKQIAALHPQLHGWATKGALDAGRLTAAPHIKTYIRFTEKPTKQNPAPNIEWALMTSANLSTQAWGSAAKPPKGIKNLQESIVHIQSYEIGVMVWPHLFAGGGGHLPAPVEMVPTFRTDSSVFRSDAETIGFRMPYDLPLTPYAIRDLPWSPHSFYDAPDRHGLTWPPVGF